MSDINETLTKEAVQQLLNDAKEVTTLFIVWTNNIETLNNNKDAFASIPYYLKWVDVANIAVSGLSDTTSQETFKQLAADLITIIVVPLRGMIEAMTAQAASKKQQLPVPTTPAPADVFAYKKWAIEYIGTVLKWMKGLPA